MSAAAGGRAADTARPLAAAHQKPAGAAEMHAVCLSYSFDPRLTTPDALLDRCDTLVGWAEAVKAAGARVTVVQRFGSDAEVVRNAIPYRFVRDPSWRSGSLLDRAPRLNQAVLSAQPDIVHVNGQQFARQALLLKRLLRHRRKSAHIPILLQDHKCFPPRRWINRRTLAPALRRMDALSFASRDLAEPWLKGGFLRPDQPILELMEGSCDFSMRPQDAARARTGLSGSPLCLWVGRLEPHKDPLTVLRGFAQALPSMPDARLAMVYGTETLLPEVRKWIAENPGAGGLVTLLGQRPHPELEDIFNSADIFLLGSNSEGSGYAVIEALACGVVPVVTNIPSFRVLTGEGTIGGLFPVGDAEALALVLRGRYSAMHPGARAEVRAFFEMNFHWNAIGRAAVAAYQSLLTRA
ncbi:MAG TPA: glycosyltransferase family 4 protein [Candidatus Acidoferrales bacterium]|nr:glycosyltransferase family 4 protein [Candidatus Acidoferrales bacterium]